MSFKDKYLKYKYKYLELKQIIQTGQRYKAYLNLEGGSKESSTASGVGSKESSTASDVGSKRPNIDSATAGSGREKNTRFDLNNLPQYESSDPTKILIRTKTGGNVWADIIRNIIKKFLQPTLHRMIRTSIDYLYYGKEKVQLSTDPEINYQNSLYFYNDADHHDFYDDINKFKTKICVGYVLESSHETIKIIKGLINKQIPQLIEHRLIKIMEENEKLNISEEVIEQKLKNTINDYIDNYIGPADLDINMPGFKPFPIIIVKPDPNTSNEIYIDSIYTTYTDGIIVNDERFILPDRKNVQFADILLGNIMFKQLVYRAESE